ncbi:MAG TPA: bifunctional ornithine acetyltransferase/N-acetylglutamate synthase, partial [Actinomycetota bacterium]|nr:bifunctional ornithine acetyltransferase/N-acetylglutamate synthase [Actinomycetota bacterium]
MDVGVDEEMVVVDYTVAGVEGGVCAPRGFRAAGVDAGLVDGPGSDLGLVVSQQSAAAAGRFTGHRFASAPVRWSRLQVAAGAARAVLVHAGAANAATGTRGDADAAALAELCAAAVGCTATEVLLLGTGPIGRRLELEAAAEGAEKAVAALGRRGSTELARALAASGGVAREHAVAVAWSEGEVRIGGVAKASVPFAPSFASTLVLLTTDATVEPAVLDGILERALGRSFERILVDQGPSMADSAILLANATAAAPVLSAGSEGAAAFEAALAYLCESLGEQLAMRIPGSRKLIVVTVHGAASHADALAAARAVAGSVALRAALAAGLPAWPAVLDAIDRAAIPLDPTLVGVRFGPVTVVAGGEAAAHDERAAAAVAAKGQVDLAVDLGAGEAAVWAAEPLQHLGAAEAGHHHVEDHHGGEDRAGEPQPLLAVGGED